MPDYVLTIEGKDYEVNGATENQLPEISRSILKSLGKETPQAAEETSVPEASSPARMAGAVARGAGPIATGAAIGAAMGGLPTGGIGALPGAALGAATMVAGDMGVGLINKLFDTHYTAPSEAVLHLLTAAGVPEAKTETEKVIQAAAQGGAEAFAGTGIGRMLMKSGNSTVQLIGKLLAENPQTQVAAGTTAGGASEVAKQQGAGALGQLAAAGTAAGAVGVLEAGPQIAKSVLQSLEGILPKEAAPVVESAVNRAVAEYVPPAGAAAPENVFKDANYRPPAGLEAPENVRRTPAYEPPAGAAAPKNVFKDANYRPPAGLEAPENVRKNLDYVPPAGFEAPPNVRRDYQPPAGLEAPENVRRTPVYEPPAGAAAPENVRKDVNYRPPAGFEAPENVRRTPAYEPPAGAAAPENVRKDVNYRPPAGFEAPENVRRPKAEPAPVSEAPATLDFPRGNFLTQEEVADLWRRAAEKDPTALQEIAYYADVDKDLFKKAKALGFEIPAEVFARNEQIQSAFGGARGAVASAEEAEFQKMAKGTLEKAGSLLEEAGASQESTFSRSVKADLESRIADLEKKKTELYAQVDPKIPMGQPADSGNLVSYLKQRIRNLGSDSKRLTAFEQRLYKQAVEEKAPLTYEGLLTKKEELEQSLGEAAGLTGKNKMELLSALKKDRENTIRQVSRNVGEDLLTPLKEAHAIEAQLLDSENGLKTLYTKGFGEKGNRDIAENLKLALSDVKKGSEKELRDLLKIVPQERHAEALMTSIFANSKNRNVTSDASFGTTQFVDFWKKLNGQPLVLKDVASILGPERMDMLNTLYGVSKYMNTATGAVKQTGKANQFPELVRRMTVGEKLKQSKFSLPAIGTFVGGKVASFIDPSLTVEGALTGGALGQVFAKTPPDKLAVASKMMATDEFKNLLLTQTAMPQNKKGIRDAIKEVLRSPAFLKYAKTYGIPTLNRETWIKERLGEKE